LYGDHVRPSVFDLVSATKQRGVFSLNLYGCNLQKLQAMCEFRENPLSDTTKQPGVFSLNFYGCNLQKLQAMCEFRENPLSDNHTLFNVVRQLLPYFQ